LQQQKQATTKASNNKSKQQQKQATTKASNNKSKQQQKQATTKQPTTKTTNNKSNHGFRGNSHGVTRMHLPCCSVAVSVKSVVAFVFFLKQ